MDNAWFCAKKLKDRGKKQANSLETYQDQAVGSLLEKDGSKRMESTNEETQVKRSGW